MDNQLLLELKAYIARHSGVTQSVVQDFYIEHSKTGDFMIMEPKEELSEALLREKVESGAKKPEAKKPEAKKPKDTLFHKIHVRQCETDLEDYIRKTKREETFSTRLLKHIDLTGLNDADIYKRAGIDRRHFSKIRCDKNYKPKKSTVVVLCLALRLSEEQTNELLKLAGYSLSSSDTGDLVVRFCIGKEIYDLSEVNEALVYFGVKALGVVE